MNYLPIIALVVLPVAQTYPEVATPPLYTIVGNYSEPATELTPNAVASKIQKEFNITMQGFEYEHLQWAYEKFADVKKRSKKFFTLTSGAVIQMRNHEQGYSYQASCRNHKPVSDQVGIYLHPHADKEKFQLTLIHELGHLIQICNDDIQAQYTNHIKALEQEGGITAYARNPGCASGTNNERSLRNEDYAEMITYYLSPNAKERDIVNCPPDNTIPYQNLASKYPRHLEVVKKVLDD